MRRSPPGMVLKPCKYSRLGITSDNAFISPIHEYLQLASKKTSKNGILDQQVTVIQNTNGPLGKVQWSYEIVRFFQGPFGGFCWRFLGDIFLKVILGNVCLTPTI